MTDILPQEIEVRYILPALRGALAKALVKDHKVAQKKAAKLLGLTEAAISQYVHGKRGNEVEFAPAVHKEIQNSAQRILDEQKNKHAVIQELYRLSHLTSIKKVMCDLHRKSSNEFNDCTICFEDELVQVKS